MTGTTTTTKLTSTIWAPTTTGAPTDDRTTTRTALRYWVVCEGTFTTQCKTEAEARAKAQRLDADGVNVLRIERQVMTTTTTVICEF